MYRKNLNFLKGVFVRNGYAPREIENLLKPQVKGNKSQEVEEDTRGVAIIPFCSTISNRVTRVLKRQCPNLPKSWSNGGGQ